MFFEVSRRLQLGSSYPDPARRALPPSASAICRRPHQTPSGSGMMTRPRLPRMRSTQVAFGTSRVKRSMSRTWRSLNETGSVVCVHSRPDPAALGRRMPRTVRRVLSPWLRIRQPSRCFPFSVGPPELLPGAVGCLSRRVPVIGCFVAPISEVDRAWSVRPVACRMHPPGALDLFSRTIQRWNIADNGGPDFCTPPNRRNVEAERYKAQRRIRQIVVMRRAGRMIHAVATASRCPALQIANLGDQSAIIDQFDPTGI